MHRFGQQAGRQGQVGGQAGHGGTKGSKGPGVVCVRKPAIERCQRSASVRTVLALAFFFLYICYLRSAGCVRGVGFPLLADLPACADLPVRQEEGSVWVARGAM